MKLFFKNSQNVQVREKNDNSRFTYFTVFLELRRETHKENKAV